MKFLETLVEVLEYAKTLEVASAPHERLDSSANPIMLPLT